MCATENRVGERDRKHEVDRCWVKGVMVEGESLLAPILLFSFSLDAPSPSSLKSIDWSTFNGVRVFLFSKEGEDGFYPNYIQLSL